METCSFSQAIAREIAQYGSRGFSLTPILERTDALSVACLYLEPKGVIGAHPAGGDQLLLVVAGRGVVMEAESVPKDVVAGNAVLWRSGEVHETRATVAGLVAIVAEGEELASRLLIRGGADMAPDQG